MLASAGARLPGEHVTKFFHIALGFLSEGNWLLFANWLGTRDKIVSLQAIWNPSLRSNAPRRRNGWKSKIIWKDHKLKYSTKSSCLGIWYIIHHEIINEHRPFTFDFYLSLIMDNDWRSASSHRNRWYVLVPSSLPSLWQQQHCSSYILTRSSFPPNVICEKIAPPALGARSVHLVIVTTTINVVKVYCVPILMETNFVLLGLITVRPTARRTVN